MRLPLSRVAPVILLFLTAACSSAPTPAAHEAAGPSVTVGAVDTRDWPRFTEAGGTLTSRLTAVVSSRILAPIVAVHVRAGDRVKRGQVVVELDAAESRAQASRSTSSLDAARLAADAAAADVAGAEAALELAAVTHERLRRLHEERSATRQELDQAVAALAAARSRLAAARAGAESAAAAFSASRAAADAGGIVAAYGALSAPFDGVVVERYVDPGTMAAPGVPLLVIEDPQATRLIVTLDASRAAGVAVGGTVDVHVDADDTGGPGVTGRVAEIARVDPGSQSFTVKIDVPSKPGWRSGFFGRARFRGASRQVTTAPAAALLARGQLTFVLVVSNDQVARLRAIRTGDRLDDRVEVLAGLAAGEALIVNPPAGLTDGARVTVGGRSAGAGEPESGR